MEPNMCETSLNSHENNCMPISWTIITISIPRTKMKDKIFVENSMFFYFDEKYFHVKINIYGDIAELVSQYGFLTLGSNAHTTRIGCFYWGVVLNNRAAFQFCNNFFPSIS